MTNDRHTAALSAFALVASLRAALGVSRGIAARRAGVDPSEDEPNENALEDLRAALERMGSLLVRLRLRTVVGAAEDEEAALVQAFEDRVALADLAEELRVAHQKLLSLFPEVEAALVEAVRFQYGEAEHLATTDDLAPLLGLFLEDLAGTLGRLRHALAEQA